AEFRVPAAFFLSFGPDNSGKAVYAMLRSPRFLMKMLRTNAPGLYGWRTALYGTLLPAPMIGEALPGLCRRIEQEGHEAELHAWDHRTWQDSLPRKKPAWVRDWFARAVESYGRCLGHPPRAFGAPSWLLSDVAVAAIAGYEWDYLSTTRAREPFVLSGTGLVEVPSDLPCLEEAGGAAGVPRIIDALAGGGIHVLPVHAEAEGGIWREPFREILRGAAEMGYRVAPMSEIAGIWRRRRLPERPFRLERLPGRAFPCAV
ncbi:MAG TPA: polysaccharide deacetylase family protein, partial [Candidatus Deferrimicrobiaceae bacterium]